MFSNQTNKMIEMHWIVFFKHVFQEKIYKGYFEIEHFGLLHVKVCWYQLLL